MATAGPNSKELPKDRLATTDASGRRIYLYPADYKGKWRTFRGWFQAILLIFFLAMPWVKVGGIQSILLDISNRRFSIFGLQFWAHDAPMVFFVFGGFVFALAFVTAVWGRLWCGWACPQTVFVEIIFRKIERFIEGDGFTRRKLDAAVWSVGKVTKKTLKWLAYIVVTLVITHSFLAYFVGTEELFKMVRSSPSENMASFLTMFISSVIVLFDFGWFREQFCTIACPYGRLQSVFMDDQSVVVGYDYRRGEPRTGAKQAQSVTPSPTLEPEKKGDCVNCYRCVQVCPTGVDIRRGVQLECIACTACIDACDEVMTRLKKPTGLISYTTESILKGNPALSFRLRPMFYGVLFVVLTFGLVYLLSVRKDVDIVFLRSKESPYTVNKLTDGREEVINHYNVELTNRNFSDVEVFFDLSEEGHSQGVSLITPMKPFVLSAGKTDRASIFFKMPKAIFQVGHAKLKVLVLYKAKGSEVGSNSAHEMTEVINVVGPF